MPSIYREAQSELVGTNPLVATIRFVFADDQPDANKRVLEYSEFPDVIRTSIGMPVKMRFDGWNVGDHKGAIPIGAITSMEEETLSDTHHQLVATATLWTDEYPEEVAWLRKKYEEKKAPGISYELAYSDAEHVGGLEKIRGVITAAAAFVRVPAFGRRTPLLALASLMENPDNDEEVRKLLEDILDVKGGNSMDEKEIERLRAEAAVADTLKAEAVTKDATIADLTAQLTAKDGELTAASEKIATMERDQLLNDRVKKFTDAGFALEAEAEKADKRKNLFASLSDEQFDAYLEDLIAAKPKEPARAQAGFRAMASRGTELPKLEVEQPADITTLRASMRGLARPNSVE